MQKEFIPNAADNHLPYSPYTVSTSLYENAVRQVEPFDAHGYDSNVISLNATSTDNDKNKAKTDISNNKISPMIRIATDYNNIMDNIDSKYSSLGTNISNVNSLRTDVSNNPLSDYRADYNYSLEPRIKSVVDVRLDDIDESISQLNTTYTLGTVTAITLIIAGVFIMRE